jgi:hypothetical protein
MTYCGPTTQSYNMTHMNFKPLYQPPVSTTTIYGKLKANGNFTQFIKILDLSAYKERLNDDQSNFTLFAVPDIVLNGLNPLIFSNLDRNSATNIISTMLLDNKIDSKTLQQSPVSYIDSRNVNQSLYVTNIRGETRINNCCLVKEFDINCSNGMIHITDGLLFSSSDHFMT